jgi:hypothetical protein
MIQAKPLPIDTIIGPFLRFARLEASVGILLPFATVEALIWSGHGRCFGFEACKIALGTWALFFLLKLTIP